MVHTIDGMVFEQHQTVFVFILTIFFFVLQEAGMFMIVMDELYGYICAGIVLVGMGVTYHYALRIYNRFHFDKEKAEWADEPNPVAEFNQMCPELAHGAQSASAAQGQSPKGEGVLSSDDPRSIHPDEDSPAAAGKGSAVGPVMEGYLAVKTARRFTTDPWERRYFVLSGANVFFYPDKRAFQLAPADPINRRPIDLEGYTLVAGAVEPPYAISLIPIDAEDIRKAWKFRCDTLAEFHNWIDIFSKALRLCNSGADSELVVVDSGRS